jgi:hypothetical protein
MLDMAASWDDALQIRRAIMEAARNAVDRSAASTAVGKIRRLRDGRNADRGVKLRATHAHPREDVLFDELIEHRARI